MKLLYLRVVGTLREDSLSSLFQRRTKKQKNTGQDLQKRNQRTIISKLIGQSGSTKKTRARNQRLQERMIGIQKV